MTKSYIKRLPYTTSYYKDEACTLLHREDGPAIEYYNGTKVWFVNGKRHRTDGPAYDYAEGDREWWLNDERYSEEEHKRLVKMINFL